MVEQVWDFAAIVDPIGVDQFFSDYWERKPLLIKRNEKGYYGSLLETKDLEAIVSRGDLRFPALRLARDGMFYGPEAYAHARKFGSDSFEGIPDMAFVDREYRVGASISLPALDRIWPPLAALCRAMDDSFDHPAHTNVYIAPGNAHGFTPHHDTHEVFVLQIGGKKRWRVFDPVLPLPHWTQTFNPTGYKPPPPIMEFDLEPGDMLYLPRGFVHTTTTPDSFSAHVTLGVTTFTWIELAGELLQTAKNRRDFRCALPPGFVKTAATKNALKSELRRLLEDLIETADYDALVAAFTLKVAAGLAKPAFSFTADVDVVGPDTELALSDRSAFRLSLEGQTLMLECAGRKFGFPAATRPTIEAFHANARFRARDLPGPLDEEARLRLVRYLCQEGVLTQVESAGRRTVEIGLDDGRSP